MPNESVASVTATGVQESDLTSIKTTMLRSYLSASLVVSLSLLGCGGEMTPVDGDLESPDEEFATIQAGLTSDSALASVVINDNLSYVYSGTPLTVKLTTTAPCGVGGCSFKSYTTNSGLFPVPPAWLVAEGASSSTSSITVGNTSYANPVLIYAGPKSIWLDVYPALGAPAADGSYAMLGFGSSYRNPNGSVTKSLNLEMAKRNCDSQVATTATRQCRAAIPNGVLTKVGGYIIKGEYKNSRGLLQYDVTQKLKCSRPI